MKKVGLLCGREYSFPPAFIAKVNQLGKTERVAAEFVKLGGTRMNEAAEYSVIVDRISHELEYYRGYLKHAGPLVSIDGEAIDISDIQADAEAVADPAATPKKP